MSDTSRHEDWVEVFRTSTDYEADIVRDRLDDAGIPAVVFTQRDHVFNLNVGNLALVSVRVPALCRGGPPPSGRDGRRRNAAPGGRSSRSRSTARTRSGDGGAARLGRRSSGTGPARR
ncbi:DUF2007 domain-containing protein [Rhodothermus marinus]|uniref:DUF2007 domain-containing protein n=1 Tax=Rhodothermus marinus TaxID=29549 RepID=UPI000AF8B32C|nr:DUF2007 domain-containing protein [Rhodothermus marinus]